MCINRVIASDHSGRRLKVLHGPEPILWYLWFVGSFPTLILPLSSLQGGPQGWEWAARGPNAEPLEASGGVLAGQGAAYSLGCWDL